MHLNKKVSIAIASALLLLPTLVLSASPNPEDKTSNYNMLLISLVCLMLILLLVIGILANTLRQLAIVIRDKMRKERKSGVATLKTILLLTAFSLQAIQVFATETEKVRITVNFIDGIPANDFYSIMAVILLEFIVIFALVIYTRVLLHIIVNKPELIPAAKTIVKKNWFWDNFNKAVPIEKEKDLLLDHNYDGIQELDNSLPPWWKYGFYITIIVAIIYLYRFHISHDGLSQKEEYTAEMQKGEEDKAAYLAKSANNIDEKSVTMLTVASELAAGKEIFITACAACHLADGGGIVGPNLTDEYWLHGGSIKDIFKTIKYGWQEKGMKSWKDDYSPKQIQELASYIKSLKGTHPATPKAPQGDLYIETASKATAADSSNKN